MRDSGNVNGIRDLTQLRDAGFAKNLGTDAGLGKKRYLVSAMTEFRDGGFSCKKSAYHDPEQAKTLFHCSSVVFLVYNQVTRQPCWVLKEFI